jgi:predicted MarR family transcription regulator
LSEAAIATLIAHKGHSITSRYVHIADAVLLDAVANATWKLGSAQSQFGAGSSATSVAIRST